MAARRALGYYARWRRAGEPVWQVSSHTTREAAERVLRGKAACGYETSLRSLH